MKALRPLLLALLVAGVIAVIALLSHHTPPKPLPEGPAATPPPTPIPVSLTLFFPGNDDLLHREQRETARISAAPAACTRLVMEELLAGSQQGLASAFPWPATVDAIFFTADGTAFIDLSPPPAGAVEGVSTELALAYASVNTVVANCPPASRVQLLFGGHEVKTLGHLDLSHPLAPRPDFVAP